MALPMAKKAKLAVTWVVAPNPVWQSKRVAPCSPEEVSGFAKQTSPCSLSAG